MNIEIDDEEAIAAICKEFGYRVNVPQPDWVPTQGQTILQRPVVANPESPADFAQRCIYGYISTLVTQIRQKTAQASALKTVAKADYYSAAGKAKPGDAIKS
jgi:hypothetical protein